MLAIFALYYSDCPCGPEEGTDRGILLTPYDPNFEKAMILYVKRVKQYRKALDKLAK
jgi:hypothetical protein